MKTITLISSVLFGMVMLTAPARAQEIPNGNFADWENREIPLALGGGTYLTPSGYWDCFNILAPGCVTKTEGRVAGSSAALLESKVVDMSSVGFEGENVTTAILATDRYLSKLSGDPYEQGVNFKTLPNYLVFWYKYEPVGKDTAQVFIQFNEEWIIREDITRTVKFRKQITERTPQWTMGYIDLSMDEKKELESPNSWARQAVQAYCIDITSSISGFSSSTQGPGAAAPGSKFWITDLSFVSELTNIPDVQGERKAQSATYNTLGQRVGESYRGVVIKNGKKAIKK